MTVTELLRKKHNQDVIKENKKNGTSDVSDINNTGEENDITIDNLFEMRKNNQVVYDPDEIARWFKETNFQMNVLSTHSKESNLPYNTASHMKNYNDSLTELKSQSGIVRSYINSLKGTEQYNALNKQFENYNSAIDSMLNYTKGVTDYVNQFDGEDEYNKAHTESTRREKYSGLKNYDEYLNAINSTDDEDEKEWLENKAYEIATSNDIQRRIDAYNNSHKADPEEVERWNASSHGGLIGGVSPEFRQQAENNEATSAWKKQLEQKKGEEKVAEERNNLNQFYYNLTPNERDAVYHYIEQKKAEENTEVKRSNNNIFFQDNVFGGSSNNPFYNSLIIPQPDESYTGQKKQIEEAIDKDNELFPRKDMPDLRIDENGNLTTPEKKLTINELATKLNTTVDNLVKWYKRGEEDDEAQYQYNKEKDEAKIEPFWRSYQSVIEKPIRDIGSAIAQIYAGTTDDKYINTKALPSARVEAIREAVPEDWDDAAKQWYGIGMGTADSAYNMLLGAAAGNAAGVAGASGSAANAIQDAVTLSPAYTSASTDAFNRVIESGGDYNNAMATGIASGLAEVITEKVSLDQLKGFKAKGVSNFRTAIGNIAKSMIVEGSEEVAADLTNTFTDSLINGGLSEVELNKKKYKDQGYSSKEAEKKAFGDWAYGLGVSFVGGAAGGALFGAGTSALVGGMNAADNYISGYDVKQNGNTGELVDIGSTYRKGSDTARTADKIASLYNQGIDPSTYQVGKLRNSIMNDSIMPDTDISNPKEVNSRVQSFVDEQNLNKKEKVIVNKLIKGKQLSVAEETTLDNSSGLKNVVANIDSVDETLADNFARALYSTDKSGFKLSNTRLRGIQSLKLHKDNMSYSEQLSALSKYADAYNMSSREKAALIKNYDGKTNIDSYATNFLAYNNEGRIAAPKTDIPKEYIEAYETGLIEYKTNLQAKYALTKAQQKLRKKNNGYGEGVVNIDSISKTKLTSDQKVNIRYVNKFAKSSGVNINWYESKAINDSGIIIEPNGYYDPDTNTVHLDINAGRENINKALTQGAIHNTFSHELTHIAENAPEEYMALRKAIQNAVGKDAWDAAVNKQLEQYRANHPEDAARMSDEELMERASSEAVAEYCSNLLKDSSLLEQIVKDNPSLFDKIKEFIKKVIGELRALHARITDNYSVNNDYANDLASNIDNLEALLTKWESAVKQGIKNQNAKTAKPNKKSSSNATSVQEMSRHNSILTEEKINEILHSFNIIDNKLKDFVQIQKAVENRLEKEGFYTDIGKRSTTVINLQNNIEIEINKKGIKETFNYKNFKETSYNNRVLKLATIRNIPEIIKNASLIEDNVKNVKKDSSSSYLYLLGETVVEGKSVELKITIRKSPTKNKFYVHNIVKNQHQTTSASTNASAKTAYLSGAKDMISQPEKDVNDIFTQDRNLAAVHNLTTSELEKSLKLGGLAMPSIAVIKNDFAHTEYGEVSAIFSKDTINPERNYNNKVYGGDAWTPTYPRIEYKINEKLAYKNYKRANNIGNIPFFNPANMEPNNIEDTVNRLPDGETLIDRYRNDYGFKNAFLKDTTGEAATLKTEEIKKDKFDDEIKGIAKDIPLEMLIDLDELERKEWLDKHYEEFNSLRKKYLESIGQEPKDLLKHVAAIKAKKVWDYIKNGSQSITETISKEADAIKEIDNKVNISEYEKWLHELFDNIIEKSGIRNNADPYTSYGDRKSFEQLHYVETLDNVIKVMKSQNNGEGAFFSGAGIWGVAAKNYGTIQELKDDSGRLKSLSEDEYNQIKESFGERFTEIAQYLVDNNKGRVSDNPYTALDNAYENIVDAVRNSKTKSGIMRELKDYYKNGVNESTVDDILNLIADIGNMPTEYFEAKPQRAVGFDEVKAVVLPSDTKQSIKESLQSYDIPIFEYERNNNESRKEATQQAYNTSYTDVEGIKYNNLLFQDRGSFSNTDDVIKKTNSIVDDFTIDWDDDFDDYDIENIAMYSKLVKKDPVEAVRLIIGSSYRTASEAIKSGVEISDRTMKIIQNKIALDYSIPIKDADIIGGALQDFIKSEKKSSDIKNFETFINTLKTVIEYSETTEPWRKDQIDKINSILRETILDVSDKQMPEVLSQYDTWGNFVRTARSVGLRVRQAKNVKADSPRGTDIVALITDLNNEMGYDIYNGVNGITTATDDGDGINQLVDYLQAQKSMGIKTNMYTDGSAESVDIAAVEMAFDTAREYIQRQGTTAVDKRNSMLVRTLNELKTKQTKLLANWRAEKNNFKEAQKTLDKIKDTIETVNDDSVALAELNRQIDEAENKEIIYDEDEINRLKEERKKALDKLNKDNRRLSSLKATRGMNTLIKNATDRATQAEKEKWAERVKKVRAEKNARIEELESAPRRERAEIKKEVRDEYIRARTLTQVVDRIKKLGLRMDKMLTDPTNKMYVPTAFKGSFLNVCTAITEAMSTDVDTEVGRKISDFNNLLQIMNEGFDEENDIDYSEYENEFSPDIFKALTKASKLLSEKLEGKVIDRKNLTLDEANDILTLLQTVYDTVRDATIQLGEQEAMTNRESGGKIRSEMERLSDEEYNKHEHIARAKSLILNGIRTARMYTGYNSDSELMRHVYNLEQGNRKRNIFLMEAEKIFFEVTENNKKAYDNSLTDVVEIEYTDYEGNEQKLKITRMLGLQILMSWERELNDKKLVHMRKGGIKVADAEKLSKGKVVEAINKAAIIRKITPSLINAIDRTMTDFEWQYKKAAEKYFNEYSKAKINEVSNILKHRDLATSKYYIPFTVNRNELIKELDALKYDSTIEGMGQLKTLIYNASQTIEITGLNTVVSRHISDTAKLYGLAIPVRNFKKALNVQFRKEITDGDSVEKIPDTSVRESIEKVWGKDAVPFFEHLASDLESERESSVDASKWIGKTIKGIRNTFVVKTLTANISVIIKQAASYPTAGVYLSSGSLAKGLSSIKDVIGPGKYQSLFDEIDAHTAQHYMRRKGMSTQEIADLSNSMFNKLPTALNATKWIQGVDVFTTALLWNATKAEINTKYRKNGKSIKTEEYWNDVTELYDRVIEDTQPMYDSLHRTEVQKTTNELWKSVFMFKTQPLQNTGIIYDAAGDALRNKTSKAKRTLAKAIASQVASLAVFAGMTFVAAAALAKVKRYKDDDDEVTPQSVFSNIGLDMLINAAGIAVPIGGNEIATAISDKLVKGRSWDLVSVPFVDMLNDTKTSADKLMDSLTKLSDKAEYGYNVKFNDVFSPLHTFAEQMSGFFGIPVKNVENILNGVYTYFVQHSNPFESQGGRKPAEYAESYGKNFTQGNTQKAKSQLATLYQEKLDVGKENGKDEIDARKDAFNAVRDALVSKYKLEYQKAYYKNDSKKMQEIENLLNSSGFMVYKNKSFAEVLAEWREKAKKDIGAYINK